MRPVSGAGRGAVGDANPHRREQGPERAPGATPPGNGPPSSKSEHLVRRNRPDVWDGPLARTPARRHGPGEPDLGRVDLLGARDSDGPCQAALRECVPEAAAAAAAVCGIGEHDAEADPSTQHTIELGESNLGLGPVQPHRLRHTCLGQAGGVFGPDLRQIKPQRKPLTSTKLRNKRSLPGEQAPAALVAAQAGSRKKPRAVSQKIARRSSAERPARSTVPTGSGSPMSKG